MPNEETVHFRELQMMGMLLPLGIEEDNEFKPDAETVALAQRADGFLAHRGAPVLR